MRLLIKLSSVLIVALLVLYSCRKDKGKDPEAGYGDFALLDSCKNPVAFRYYKNDPNTIYPGNNGAHGTFKLKFNHKAYAQLVDSGKLPVGAKFTDGSMVVKEVMSGSSITKYAVIYKRNGSWLWAEITPGMNVEHSVKADPGICTSCHNQSGNRDQVATFIYH